MENGVLMDLFEDGLSIDAEDVFACGMTGKRHQTLAILVLLEKRGKYMNVRQTPPKLLPSHSLRTASHKLDWC
jgi:hypothetical protein